MSIVGQSQTDPVTGVSGEVYDALLARPYAGLVASHLNPGDPPRDAVAALCEAVAEAIVAHEGGGTLVGDVTGLASANTVEALQGTPVDATAPATGDVLAYDGSAWAPTAPSSGGAAPLSVIDMCLVRAAPAVAGGSYTTGIQFAVTAAKSCTGVRFRWPGGAKTIRVKLWNAGGQLATVDVVVGGAGTYVGTFASPVALTAYTNYRASQWETGGAQYAGSGSLAGVAAPARPFVTADLVYEAVNSYGVGDANPTNNGSEFYLAEPVLA